MRLLAEKALELASNFVSLSAGEIATYDGREGGERLMKIPVIDALAPAASSTKGN